MARTPRQKAAEPTVPEGIPEAHSLTVAETELDAKIQKIQEGYSEERDLVNQLLGQAQMSGAFEEFSRTVRTSKLAFVKENKLYRAIKGKKSPHGAEIMDGTWEEFCGLLGRSVDQVDRDISNLRTFGEEALESMSRMGIGYRDLRQFRRLPADQKTELIEAAKSGDKDSFLELAEDLIAKHAQEKETLETEKAELQADHEALGKVVEDKNKKLDQLERQIKKTATQPWDAQVPKLNEEINMIFDVVMECADKLLAVKDVFLQASFENDRDESATKMLALNYFDRTQRMVEAVALIQQVAFEDLDCYINAPKRKLITEDAA